MARWLDEPWAKAPEILLNALGATYKKAIELGKVETPAKTALKKAMAFRKWIPAVPQDQLLEAIEALGMLYVPDGVGPGPGFLFPIRDVSGQIMRAHIRLCDDKKYGSRYISLVDKDRFVGPSWLGTDSDTLDTIIETGAVMVMEGPFDLLAIRTVDPRVPSLCSLTKRLSPRHFDYLNILGVNRVYVMFDNQEQGDSAYAAMAIKHKDLEIIKYVCPSHDPSDALRNPIHMMNLRRSLRGIIQSEGGDVFELEEPEDDET